MIYRWKGPRIRCLALRAASRAAIQVRERHRDPFDVHGWPDAVEEYPVLGLFFAVGAVESTWPADDCFNAMLDLREQGQPWPWRKVS